MKQADSRFLFSIDLEDVRNMVPNGQSYAPHVPEMTERFLAFLASHNQQCTFFVVGDMLDTYPELITQIADVGHEIACHTNKHTPLPQLGKNGFKKDIEVFLAKAQKLGLPAIKGFRAPTFSLTEKTPWAHGVLEEFGFVYSSSVLPAKNPLFGWEGFGQSPKKIGNLWEIPMTIQHFGPMQIPVGGGVYFRLLPQFVLKQIFSRAKKNGNDIFGYFHPYDIDTEQEKFMHPGLNGSRLYNQLMFIGRSSVFSKLETMLSLDFRIIRYDQYIKELVAKDATIKGSNG